MTDALALLRPPDRVTAFTESGVLTLNDTNGEWRAEDVCVVTTPDAASLPVQVTAPESALCRLRLRWRVPVPQQARFLGDHWERGYGDLEWRGLVPERVMPWYFLVHDGDRTDGYGVKTGARSLCFWQTDGGGVSLWLDVRNGGRGVRLGDRILDAATIIVREGTDGESPFAAAQAFCRQMCDTPRLPPHPIYGGNNWYYAYGRSSHAEILQDSRLMASLAPDTDNRPYMVIDDGWQFSRQLSRGACGGGPWTNGNADFPDMPKLAREMVEAGVRPGLWTRPLLTTEQLSSEWLLPSGRFGHADEGFLLDPTVPEVRALIAADVRRMVDWGYTLIKHDFTTYDLLGRWGFAMGAEVTDKGWGFADDSLTTAEVILALYETLRQGAGDALLLGCNTVGHLGAGLFELQRTGDDTSGREWERTRRMGVNTLAFRMPQHDAFFAVDADCIGLTGQVPWEMNRQWLDLLARSGTPLFVSAAPDAVGPEQQQALQAAFALAATSQPVGEPLDWLNTTCPRHWRLGGQETTYDWYDGEGASPFRT